MNSSLVLLQGFITKSIIFDAKEFSLVFVQKYVITAWPCHEWFKTSLICLNLQLFNTFKWLPVNKIVSGYRLKNYKYYNFEWGTRLEILTQSWQSKTFQNVNNSKARMSFISMLTILLIILVLKAGWPKTTAHVDVIK